MRALAGVITLTFVSCGHMPEVDPELKPYVARFVAKARAMKQVPREDFDVVFGKPRTESSEGFKPLAECQYATIAHIIYPNRVVVDRDEWENLSEAGKQLVMDHELIHCALQIYGHDDRDDHLMSSSFDMEYVQMMDWPTYYKITSAFWRSDFKMMEKDR